MVGLRRGPLYILDGPSAHLGVEQRARVTRFVKLHAEGRETEGVILASSVNKWADSGLFRVFVDRFCYIFHRPTSIDMKAFLLTTTGAVDLREIPSCLSLVAQVWGFEVAGRAGLVSILLLSPNVTYSQSNALFHYPEWP